MINVIFFVRLVLFDIICAPRDHHFHDLKKRVNVSAFVTETRKFVFSKLLMLDALLTLRAPYRIRETGV